MTEESIAILAAHLQALDVNELGLFFFSFLFVFMFFPWGHLQVNQSKLV